MLKNLRIIIWIFFIVISFIALAPNPNPSGVMVTAVSGSASEALSVGDVIFKINGQPATPDIVNQQFFDIIKIETNKGAKFVRVNGTLGAVVEKPPISNLKFGLDLKGGTRAIVEPNTTDKELINQIVSTLETRINLFGLREATFRPLYSGEKGFVEVSIAGGTEQELIDLLEKQGKFESKIPVLLDVANNKTSLNLEKNYEISVSENAVSVDDKNVNVGETFEISGIIFRLDEISGKKINLTSTVFSGADIVTVFFDPQRSIIEPTPAGDFKWQFAVEISRSGAERFALVTKNIKTTPSGYLESPIIILLDDEIIDTLNIASSLKGRAETQVSISGGAASFKEAVSERAQLQSILRSGALPASIEIVQLDTISPNLGSDFLKTAILAGLVAQIGVLAVVAIRYRRIKIVLPMVAVSLSELLIILGIASIIGWTIDLSSIAGIIASIGTGINDQIIIIDESTRKAEEESIRQKLKKAYFIIFGAAGTMIGAMIPLFAVGFGVLRGFALTTIIGVLIGILITRPAFGVIVERFVSKSEADKVQ